MHLIYAVGETHRRRMVGGVVAVRATVYASKKLDRISQVCRIMDFLGIPPTRGKPTMATKKKAAKKAAKKVAAKKPVKKAAKKAAKKAPAKKAAKKAAPKKAVKKAVKKAARKPKPPAPPAAVVPPAPEPPQGGEVSGGNEPLF